MPAQEYRACSNCNKPLPQNLELFCCRECHYAGMRKRISILCHGCGKSFQIKPYLKRKTNYCSLTCYRKTTLTCQVKICRICRKEFIATGSQVRNNFGIYCSRKCQNKINIERRKSVNCRQCGTQIVKPPSVAKLTKFCSKVCHDNYMRDYVIKTCNHCCKEFELPTWETRKGKGMFCSRYCYVHYNGESSIEAIMRKALEEQKINFQQEVKFGKYHADFFLPERKIVIECDSYWHESEFVRKRDERKDIFLKKLGYQIFRFSETQIKKSALKCLENLSAGKFLDKETITS